MAPPSEEPHTREGLGRLTGVAGRAPTLAACRSTFPAGSNGRQPDSLTPALSVRTLDGIHLAAADLHGADAVVATDTNLRKCATAIGLKLYP